MKTAIRMLDNVIDLSRYPLAQQAAVERERRRIGLGLTGLADALAMLGLHYGEPPARRTAAETLRAVCHAAYRSSIELAREKGCFPLFSRSRYLAGRFVQTLPEDIRRGIARYGLRNSHLIAIAPAGTISLLANNVSSGIEPMYGLTYDRHILQPDGRYRHYRVNSYAWRAWRARHDGPPPSHFVTAHALPPEAHLAMQAALQPYVDNAIAKTVNLPPTLSFASFQAIYEQAYDKGLKGCTTFRSTPARGAILSTRPEQTAPACCDQESEPG